MLLTATLFATVEFPFTPSPPSYTPAYHSLPLSISTLLINHPGSREDKGSYRAWRVKDVQRAWGRNFLSMAEMEGERGGRGVTDGCLCVGLLCFLLTPDTDGVELWSVSNLWVLHMCLFLFCLFFHMFVEEQWNKQEEQHLSFHLNSAGVSELSSWCSFINVFIHRREPETHTAHSGSHKHGCWPLRFRHPKTDQLSCQRVKSSQFKFSFALTVTFPMNSGSWWKELL